VAVAALHSLAARGAIPHETVARAIESYELSPECAAPWRR
jgi:pyruvate dehydrogenase complex dehydrogenase (E1) component